MTTQPKAVAASTPPATTGRLRRLLGRGFLLAAIAAFAATSASAQIPATYWRDYRDTTWPEGHMDGATYDESATFTIHTEEQLAQFAYMVRGTTNFLGKTVILNKDSLDKVLDLSAHLWEPIGNVDGVTVAFGGTFDGNGHTLDGMTIRRISSSGAVNARAGLFSSVNFGTLRNLKMTDVNIEIVAINNDSLGVQSAGALAASAGNDSLIENCVVESGTISIYLETSLPHVPGQYSSRSFGGIAGALGAGSIIRNCFNGASIELTANTTRTLSLNVGGITGSMSAAISGNHKIENCLNKGSLTILNGQGANSEQYTIGGIVGQIISNTTPAISIKNCLNTGVINGPASGAITRDYGGIFGRSVYFPPAGNLANLYYFGPGIPSPIPPGQALAYGSTTTTTGSIAINATPTAATVLASLNSWVTTNGSATYRPWEIVSGENHDFPVLDISFTSRWVTYHGNGGTPECRPVPATYGQTYNLPATDPVRPGYEFAGWWTLPTGGTAVSNSTPFTTTSPPIISAHWILSAPPATPHRVLMTGIEVDIETGDVTLDWDVSIFESVEIDDTEIRYTTVLPDVASSWLNLRAPDRPQFPGVDDEIEVKVKTANVEHTAVVPGEYLMNLAASLVGGNTDRGFFYVIVHGVLKPAPEE